MKLSRCSKRFFGAIAENIFHDHGLSVFILSNINARRDGDVTYDARQKGGLGTENFPKKYVFSCMIQNGSSSDLIVNLERNF